MNGHIHFTLCLAKNQDRRNKMNDLKIFKNSEFGNLTVEVGSDNTILFFLNEVCMHLGYTKTAKRKEIFTQR